MGEGYTQGGNTHGGEVLQKRIHTREKYIQGRGYTGGIHKEEIHKKEEYLQRRDTPERDTHKERIYTGEGYTRE